MSPTLTFWLALIAVVTLAWLAAKEGLFDMMSDPVERKTDGVGKRGTVRFHWPHAVVVAVGGGSVALAVFGSWHNLWVSLVVAGAWGVLTNLCGVNALTRGARKSVSRDR